MCTRLFSILFCAAAMTAAAQAGEQEEAHKASVTLSRHYTTNALDSPLELEDWYTLLRGSVDSAIRHERGVTRITAELESRRFDTLDIENDIALGVGTDTTFAVSDALELRGTLSAKIAEEGDELLLDTVFLGTRTRKTVLSGGVQAGLRLSPATVLVLESAISRETAGKTRFEGGLLPALQLDPARDRLRAGGRLTHTQGRFAYGAYGSAGLMRAAPLDPLVELRVLDYAAGIHASVTFDNDAAVAASAGLHGVSLSGSGFRELRPAYEIAASTPLPAGLSLRGALKAAYDPQSSDDPVATWVRRIEAEAGYEPTPWMRLSSGAFMENRVSVAMESRETGRGLFAQAVWTASPRTTLSLRVDATRKVTGVGEFRLTRRTVDVGVAMNLKL